MVVKNKLLWSALVISGAWHLFWISTIRVVIVPANVEVVKFSKVSFLGSVMGGGSLEVRAEARPRSFLEERISYRIDRAFPLVYTRHEDEFVKDSFALDEGELSALLGGAMPMEKSIPPPQG